MAYLFGTCSVTSPPAGLSGICDTFEKSATCGIRTLEDCNGDIVDVQPTGKRKTFRWSYVADQEPSLDAIGTTGPNNGIITSISIRYRRGDYAIAEAVEEAPIIVGGGGGGD